jgi:hypothetical protein
VLWAQDGAYPTPATALPPTRTPPMYDSGRSDPRSTQSNASSSAGQVLTDRGALMASPYHYAETMFSSGRGGGGPSRLSSAGQQASRPSSSATADLRSQWATLASPSKQFDLVVRSSQVQMMGIADPCAGACEVVRSRVRLPDTSRENGAFRCLLAIDGSLQWGWMAALQSPSRHYNGWVMPSTCCIAWAR